MDDKTFELIEKLYNRMEERFDKQDKRIDDIEQKMATKLDIARVEQNMVRMEQIFKDKSDILFDAVQGNTEAINSLRSEMQTLETKVDEHEVKLKIVK